jgi:division protein CdvB (Snf7/Vps24/ESCRT-III family)
MKTLMIALLSLRINSIRAKQHDLQQAWAHAQRTENNGARLVMWKLDIDKRQNRLAEQRAQLEAKRRHLQTQTFSKARA